MRVGIATVASPGIEGGAEAHARNLAAAFRDAGHLVQTLEMPFYYAPPGAARISMERWEAFDFLPYRGGQIDRMVCLKFPAYAIRHPGKVVWLLHQHRPVYDLWDTPYGLSPASAEAAALREAVMAFDRRHLQDAPVFANSRRVAERLRDYNGLGSTPLYHPPSEAERFHCFPAEPYIFFPSRFETLKRQELLVRAITLSTSRVTAVFAGTGGQFERIRALVEELGAGDRVRLLGSVTRAEVIELYANALGVFFGPLDEDYGYVTLEAMLSGKPVITCTDSGGPLEFVVEGETGFVAPPEPAAIADAIDRLAAAPARAAALGRNGRARYDGLGISWSAVVEALSSATAPGQAAA
jgi:glycosyltransferase involved in cell wall biosynthesis